MSAYTWLRCNKCPLNQCLHTLGKRADHSYPCGHGPQDGGHLTFSCPSHAETRQELLRGGITWLQLDKDIYVQDKGNEEVWYETTEEWFSYLFHILAQD